MSTPLHSRTLYKLSRFHWVCTREITTFDHTIYKHLSHARWYFKVRIQFDGRTSAATGKHCFTRTSNQSTVVSNTQQTPASVARSSSALVWNLHVEILIPTAQGITPPNMTNSSETPNKIYVLYSPTVIAISTSPIEIDRCIFASFFKRSVLARHRIRNFHTHTLTYTQFTISIVLRTCPALFLTCLSVFFINLATNDSLRIVKKKTANFGHSLGALQFVPNNSSFPHARRVVRNCGETTKARELRRICRRGDKSASVAEQEFANVRVIGCRATNEWGWVGEGCWVLVVRRPRIDCASA